MLLRFEGLRYYDLLGNFVNVSFEKLAFAHKVRVCTVTCFSVEGRLVSGSEEVVLTAVG